MCRQTIHKDTSTRGAAIQTQPKMPLALLDIIAHYGKSVTLYTLGVQNLFFLAPLRGAPYPTERFGVLCLVFLREHRVTSKNFFPHVRTAGPIGFGRTFKPFIFFDAVDELAWFLRRRWGLMAWRSAARLLLDRLEFVGKSGLPAQDRRSVAASRAAALRRNAQR